MNCKKCGKPLEEIWVACPFCGTRVSAPKRTRRGNGQGSVYKVGKTWGVRVTVGHEITEGGRLRLVRRSKFGFATKADAALYAAQLRQSAEEQKAVPTLAHYWDVYSSGRLQQLSASKRQAYQIAYNKVTKRLQSTPIGSITVGDLQSLINDTCQTYYPARDLRTMLQQLYKLAAIDGNAEAGLPALLVIPPLQEEEREPFTHEEQRQLWTAYESGAADCALALVMILTGMMPGELRRLKVSQIDLEHKEIVGAGLKTKTRREQSVLLPDAALPLLADLMQHADGEQLFACTENGFYWRYYNGLKLAGITRHLTPYSCRHTTATALAIDDNIAPQTVKRVMRWASTKMLDRYAHPSDEDARAAVNRGCQ